MRKSVRIALAICMAGGALGAGCLAQQPARKQVIAHRGASGIAFEHTLEAYALAVARGADVLEPDVVRTRDGVLVCFHDLRLGRVTDVEERFPKRARADGHWYVNDFTHDELRQLRLARARGGKRLTGSVIPTLESMLAQTRRLEEVYGREIGIIPELKGPSAHRKAGLPLEEEVLKLLGRYGYRTRKDPCWIQCFDLDTLVALRAGGCDLKLVWLVYRVPGEEAVARAARVCDALGPNARLLREERFERSLPDEVALIPWTYPDDEGRMVEAFLHPRVQALFTDYPATGVRARDRAAARSQGAERK